MSSETRIPILTYHSIDDSGSVVSTTASVFQRQMKYLSDTKWNVVALNDLVRSLLEKAPIPAKTVVLTFDDGFQNFYSEAFPVLAEHRFKATVFLVTDHCGKYNDWESKSYDIPRNKLLSWSEIREMHELGVGFGSHTRTHPDLRKLSHEQVRKEMVESKLAIEDALGCQAGTFAYPYGSFNSLVKRAAEENYDLACSTKLGKVHFGGDPYALERVDAYYLLNQKIFDSLATRSFDRYLKFRRVMRDVKSLVKIGRK